MAQVRDRRMLPLAGVLTASFVVFVFMVTFGVDTSCTNAWSCTSSECSPCRVVSIAGAAGLALAASASAWVLFSPWPRRGRALLYVVAMVVIAALVLALAQSWDAPHP